MNREQFGELVKTLREELSLSRPQLAHKAGNTSAAIIETIEAGTKVDLREALVGLANALDLTSSERNAFIFAASGLEHSNITRSDTTPEKAFEELYETLSKLQAPGLIIDSYGDLLAMNAHLGVMYDIDLHAFQAVDVNPLLRYHVLRLFFSPEVQKQREMFEGSWESFAYNTILIFRTLTLQHRAEQYFKNIKSALGDEYKEFNKYWNNVKIEFEPGEKDHYTDNPKVHLRHERLGKLNMVAMVMTHWTTHGVQRLHSFLPLDKETQDSFSTISDEVANRTPVMQLAPLPGQKDL